MSLIRRRKKKQNEQLFTGFETTKGLLTGLSWTCHICKENRPDARISVLTKPVEKYKDTEMKIVENIRYCNDRPDCAAEAVTYSHYKFGEDDDGL